MHNLIKNLQHSQSKTIQPQDLQSLSKSENIYKVVGIIGARANQVSMNISGELKQKLREFDSYADNIDEYRENKEQAEMSRLYEMLPHPTLIALNEFKANKLVHKNRSEVEDETSNYTLE